MWISFSLALAAVPQIPAIEPAEFAYRCVEHHLKGTPLPEGPFSGRPTGAFITVEVEGNVRACRGSLEPRYPRLDEEIRQLAQSASLHDPRYGPVHLKGRAFSVTLTLVQSLVPLENIDQLRPDEGLVLTQNGKTGVVLPFEGKDPQTRLNWAYRKAKADVRSPARLQRLRATRTRFPQLPPK